MDNPQSLPQLVLPNVPDDFNGGVGVAYARALMLLLGGVQVEVGNDGGAQPIDLAQLQQQIETLTTAVADANRKQRLITLAGVNNVEMSVPFQDIGTTSYDITAEIMIPTGNNPASGLGLYLIEGSFQSAQFRVRCDGDLSAYTLRFVVTEIKD